jgi:hypothetical protein
MRTDSTRISDVARAGAKEYIERNFGEEYYENKYYKTSNDAHTITGTGAFSGLSTTTLTKNEVSVGEGGKLTISSTSGIYTINPEYNDCKIYSISSYGNTTDTNNKYYKTPPRDTINGTTKTATFEYFVKAATYSPFYAWDVEGGVDWSVYDENPNAEPLEAYTGNVRTLVDKIKDNMSDEELDELCRPQKANTRKSLAPLFVYEIISKNSSSKKHLRQQEILQELEKYPYEITLERKAVGRMIQNLVDSQYGIYSDKTGVWMEREEVTKSYIYNILNFLILNKKILLLWACNTLVMILFIRFEYILSII